MILDKNLRIKTLALAAALVAGTATAAQAQNQDENAALSFYLGAGIGRDMSRLSIESGGILFGSQQLRDTTAYIFAGLRFDPVTFSSAVDYYLGLELEHEFSGRYPTQRLRGMVGTPLGDATDLFLAFGLARTSDFNITGDIFDASGPTVGVGVERRLGQNVKARVEVIHDRLKGQGSSYGVNWNSTTVRAAAIFTF